MKTANPLLAVHDDPWYAGGSAWHRACRSWYDRLVLAGLGADAASRFRLVARAGRLAQACRLQGPRVAAVRELFPGFSTSRHVEIARASAGLRFMNRAAIAIWQRAGLAPLADLVQDAPVPHDLAKAGRGGVILVAYHVGAHFGVGAALHRWQVPALVLRSLPLADTDLRARALKQAVDHLRTGGVTLAVIDGPGGASSGPVTCLDRRIVLRRGPLMLARVTGATVLPIVAHWTASGRILVRTGAPLRADGAGASFEQALARAAAGWLEQHLLEHPEGAWPFMIGNLLAAPHARATPVPLVISAREEHTVNKPLIAG